MLALFMLPVSPLVHILLLVSVQVHSDCEDRVFRSQRVREREVEEERPWWEAEGVQENINETQLMRAKTE